MFARFLVLTSLLTAWGSLAIQQHSAELSCSDDSLCQVTLRLLSSSGEVLQVVELIREQDEASLFSETSRIVFADEEERHHSVRDLAEAPDVASLGLVKYRTVQDQKLFAAVWVVDNELKKGFFSTADHGVLELQADGSLVPHHQGGKRSLVSHEDVVLTLPEGMPWLTQDDELTEIAPPPASAVSTGIIGPLSSIVKFAPGCYSGDVQAHDFKMNIVIDYGLFLDLTSVSGGSDATKYAKVVQELEYQFAVTQLIYRTQLNIRLKIDQVLLGKASDPLPLSQSGSSCMTAVQAHTAMLKWNAANNGRFPAGYVMMFSNCFVGVNGVSFVGGVCQQTNNVGVASFDWFVLSHELGHGFGAQHTFQNGVGTTGGLMDYGNPKYNGAAQFHPTYTKPEICRFINSLKTSQCRWLVADTSAGSGGSCGDGILETKTEQCECLVAGQTTCGNCQNCKLVSPNVECSSQDYVLKTPAMTATSVAVSKSALASPECCTALGKLARPKTMCSSNKNVCGPAGACVPICARALGSTVASCGFDTEGCRLGCVWDSKCRFDMVYGATAKLVSGVPDGTPCVLANGQTSKCVNAKCEGGRSTAQETNAPTTASTTPPPTTKTTTTTGGGQECALLRNFGSCYAYKCSWCAASSKCLNPGAPCVRRRRSARRG